MSIILVIVVIIILFIIELLYFRLANHYNIIDKPNHRSSHSNITLRGGGIIFSVSLLLYPMYFGLQYKYFLLGLCAIAFISFVDDIKPASSKLRIIIHLFAVALMFIQIGLLSLPIYLILLALFLVIGSINAINFMDGINGITGAFSLVTLSTLLYINTYEIAFVDSSLIITSILSVIVFCFFNFRKRAKCFAGDVGSVSIAFIILFFILLLIVKTENFKYLLLLLIYGLDTVTTIVFRLIRKENILDAHRSHFYQYLANEKKKPQLIVSSSYAVIQLAANTFIIFVLTNSVLLLVTSLGFCTVVFVILRFSLEGRSKLIGD